MPEEGRGQFLEDQLTLSQPGGGAYFTHHFTTDPTKFTNLPTALCTYAN